MRPTDMEAINELRVLAECISHCVNQRSDTASGCV